MQRLCRLRGALVVDLDMYDQLLRACRRRHLLPLVGTDKCLLLGFRSFHRGVLLDHDL